MSVEVLEAQQQLDRARENLRSVEEGIKKTTTSTMRREIGGRGGGRSGRGRLAGRIAGVPRFREETEDGEDEPPYKKSLSSVASRLGPINIDTTKSKENEEDEDLPAVKSTVTLSMAQDREAASSVVNDTTNLNRSKRLFGSLLMGTLRQFKQDKEKNKSIETKQADMWDKIDKKEAEQEAMTAADRRKLEAAKEDVNEEIKLLEEKIQLAEMKDRAGQERDMYSGFIRSRTKPPIYYLPKEHCDRTNKALKESQIRVQRLYQERIDGYDDKIAEIEKKIGRSGEGIEKHLGELSTIRLESITKTIQTGGDEEENKEMETKESEDKPSNPQTGIKVEVQLRHSLLSDPSDGEQEKHATEKPSVVKNDGSIMITINKSPHEASQPEANDKNAKDLPEKESPKSPSSEIEESLPNSVEAALEKENQPVKRDEKSGERTRSPVKKIRSPDKKGRSPDKKNRSHDKKSRSPDKKSRSPRKRSIERRRGRRRSSSKRRRSSPARRRSKSSRSPRQRAKSPPSRRKKGSKSPSKKSTSKGRSRSPKQRSRSPSSHKNLRPPIKSSPVKENGKGDQKDDSSVKAENKVSASSKIASKSRSKSRSSSSSSSSSDSGKSGDSS